MTAPRSQVAEHRPAGERVVGVPAHGGQCTGGPQPRSDRCPGGTAASPTARTLDPTDRRRVYSPRYIEAIYRHAPVHSETGADVLDLAILGLLKEQPLHGYELKKRLGETLGSLWGVSYGSLYPALRRLERDGAIEIVEPGVAVGARSRPPVRSTATSRPRAAAPGPEGEPPHAQGVPDHRRAATPASRSCSSPTTPRDDERTFALKLVFCRHLEPDAPARAARAPPRRPRRRGSRTPGAIGTRGDRYTRSLFEHRTQSTQRDLEWVEALIAAEGRDRR